MSNVHTIQVRLTQTQKERVLLNAENAGYKTLSQYTRSLILERDLSSQKMIKEIYEKIMKEGYNNGKNKH
jgi:spore germination protein YaaH